MASFVGFIGEATFLKAELWAIREAMLLIKEKDQFGAIVEVDSTNVMDLINGEDCEDHLLKVMIEDCKRIAVEMGLQVSHTFLEGNQVLTLWRN